MSAPGRKKDLPDWPGNFEEARAEQDRLRGRVTLRDDGRPVRRIAGIDVGYDRRRNMAKAVAILMDADALQPLQTAVACRPALFPYVPGFLSFREAPAILEALSCLHETPDLLFIDGHGIAHPRRFGIAAHIGVLTGIPAIGVAKSRLTGDYADPGKERGSCTKLMDRGEQIGTVLRTRTGVQPLFISPGHRITQERAVEMVLVCGRGFRLPEPTRLADKFPRLSK